MGGTPLPPLTESQLSFSGKKFLKGLKMIFKGRGQKKNGMMWVEFPNWGVGGGLTQTHSIFFSVFFPIQGLIKWQKKTVKNVKIPKLGGGGSATWEFSPHNPVFF